MNTSEGSVSLVPKKSEQTIPKDDLFVYGLGSTTIRRIIYFVLSIGTGGLLFLFFRMLPWWRSLVKNYHTTLDECTKVLIKRNEEGTWMYAIAHVKYDWNYKYRYFDYMCRRYAFDQETGEFQKVEFNSKRPFRNIYQMYEPTGPGLTRRAVDEALALHGLNSLEVPVPNYVQLFIDEVLHPFYAFQVFTCFIWFWDEYWIYASCIIIISVFSAIISVRQARENRVKLFNMTHHRSEVSVFRDGAFVQVESHGIVPGDLIKLETNQHLPCDMILLQGSAVINEASLTGESIPVLKSPLPRDEEDVFDPEMHSKHVLFNGTTVMQTKPAPGSAAVIGVAYGTGFATLKGELIRSIMFPRPTKFAFYRDSFKFVLVLAGIAICGFFYTVGMFVHFGAPVTVILKRALDLFTISIPPALPVAMTIGVAYAVSRLQEEDIYCIAPSRVNVAGRVTTMCFDKTGTLTEDGLSVYGVHSTIGSVFAPDMVNHVDHFPNHVKLSMASCHTLTMLDGYLLGDPLDVQMFQATEWTLKDNPQTQRVVVSSMFATESVEILKYFEFSSLLQRMSVIAKHSPSGDVFIFCKGAPETIKNFAVPQSIPDNFDDMLSSYTRQGKRVIALSSRNLGQIEIADALKLTRQEVEKDLEFHALFILQNRLKSDTTEYIRLLKEGRISNIMVTGDNEYTAISVARECKIIDSRHSVYLMKLDQSSEIPVLQYDYVPSLQSTGHPSFLKGRGKEPAHDSYPEQHEFSWDDPNVTLAVHAKAFQYILSFDTDTYNKTLEKAVVYARMSPLNKARLVENLQTHCNLTVGMCGDGSNDCGALKAADVGLSLSEAEASAAAPFTSKKPSIESVYRLLREGRGALATSIQVYKYMGIYSLIQTVSIIILYSIGYESRLKDPQFLWIDLGLIFPLAFLMGRTHPNEELTHLRPPASLVNKSIVLSILSQIIIHMFFQIIVYCYTALAYIPANYAGLDEDGQTNLKIAILFVFANFQYIWSSVAYSIGRPFRKALWTNIPFTIALFLTLFANIWLVFHPDPLTSKLFTLGEWGTMYKIVLLAIAALNFVISWSIERFFIIGYIGAAEGEK